MLNANIGFIGGGNMAEAIIKGLLRGGVPSSSIYVGEPDNDRRRRISDTFGVVAVSSNKEVARKCTPLVLAIKPQVAQTVLQEIKGEISTDKLIISIMAGVKTEAIEGILLPGSKVTRVMPNTPALVMEAASAICAGSNAGKEELQLTSHMFELIGKTWIVEEKLLDAVTGLSGSGPAYVFSFIQALSDAGVKCGLPRDVATGLAVQTVVGSARLVAETGEHPAVLREKVTSPGGTTIAGLAVLERNGFSGTIIDAVEAAALRSKELGKSK